MEQFVTQFTGLGIAGVVCYKLMETFLKEKEDDKQAYRNELKEQREMYREELAKDRELYQNSMHIIVNRLENVEEDVREIKQNLAQK